MRGVGGDPGPTPLAPVERFCHAACGGKRRAKPLKQRTRSQVKLALDWPKIGG